MLDRATEQMATPQREDHDGDITTLGLKSPLKNARECTHTPTHTRTLSGKGQGLFFFPLLPAFVSRLGILLGAYKDSIF